MAEARPARGESFDWSDAALPDQERARRAVMAQRIICDLPAETYRRDRDLFNVRLFENNPIITLYNFAGAYYAESTSMSLPVPEQSTNNRAKAAIDTLFAQVASTNQRARFMVVDGNYRQRRRARELQNFTDGLVLELKLHQLRQRAFMDAAILESGVGAIQFFRRNGRCAAERVLATELAIDPLDGMVNKQWRTIYRHRPMPRAVVGANFGGTPAADKAIENANPVATSGAPSDHIEVFEGWTLPSEEGAGDGWHVVALDVHDGALTVEPYTKPIHEIVFFSIEDRFATGWGLGLMTQARKLQCRINANEWRIEKARKLCHSGHLYVDKAAKMAQAKFTNEIGTVWEGNGPVGPQQIKFDNVTDVWEAAVERDGQRIFENLGINLHASQAQTNTGLDASGAAKREEKASSSERNGIRQQRWEQFHLDCVDAALSVVRDCVTRSENNKDRKKQKTSYRVAVPGKRGLTMTDWKDVAIDRADYVLEIKPASPVPTDPAGLVAFGERMIEIGAWKPERLAGYIQDLDADGRVNRQMSQERGLEKKFEAMLYDKVAAFMPDEFTNYALAIEIGTEYLSQGEEDGVPEKHLERVRRYLKRCKQLATAAAQAAAKQAQALQQGGTVSQAPGMAGVPDRAPVNADAVAA
jgi:hypothetical protein